MADNVVIGLIIEDAFENDTYDGDDEEEEEDACVEVMLSEIGVIGEDADPTPKVIGYVERLVPQLTDDQFRSHFRFVTFYILLELQYFDLHYRFCWGFLPAMVR